MTITTTPSTLTAPDPLADALHAGDVATWTLAAISTALKAPDSPAGAAALAVLHAAGIDLSILEEPARPARAAQAAASLLAAATVACGQGTSWAAQPDEALLAQGRASARGGAPFARMIPMLPGAAALLARPGATLLDVGTGVGGLAVACARAVPGLRVVGIDVLPRAITLARHMVAASDVAGRVEIRLQGIQDLDETDRYATAWIPAPFIPEPALRAGVTRAAAALVPGGWLCLAHGLLAGPAIEQAITRYKTTTYGGTTLDATQAHRLLHHAGLIDITSPPTPSGDPVITLGRRPPR